jgi:hypothetical protein
MDINNITTLYVDHITGTFSDRLVTFGLARMVSELHDLQGDHGNVTIHDDGAFDRITFRQPINSTFLESTRGQALWLSDARMIKTSKNAEQIPADVSDLINYDEQRQIVDQFFAAKGKAQDDQVSPQVPHPDWDKFRAINPSALSGYNNILTQWWKSRSAYPELIVLLLTLFGETPNNVDTAVAMWKRINREFGLDLKTMVTCGQLFNPEQGKGQNNSKPVWSSPGNLDGFWLIEWLKISGFYQAAFTKVMRGVKDRKTFVVAPKMLTAAENSRIMSAFADKMRYSESATKFDTLAAIRYVQTLLEYLREPAQRSRLAIGSLKHRLVAGFHTTFYKDMGNTTATMNIAFIALPGWVIVNDLEDIDIYNDALDELEKLVSQFDESHSDSVDLLRDLRDFVSGDDLQALFRFTNAYPAYLIGMRERGKYAYSYTVQLIERLIMSIERRLSEILENEGFRNIAYAIRQSTITAQYRKKQGERKYDVRYGLGQELARKARYEQDFVAALSDFLFKYNAECAQIMETRNGPYRRMVKTDDIEQIIQLIDIFGSETVANLLIAYGHARVDRSQQEDDSTFTNAEEQN